MPDTGAPWNIPYADPTDLVRDWPALSEDVADAIALGLTNAGNAGIGSSVVQTLKTNTFTTTSARTALTGLTLTITPTTATSKILVFYRFHVSSTATDGQCRAWLVRDATDIYLGDADGSRTRVSNQFFARNNVGSMDVNGFVLDSPNTTSAVTYFVEVGGTTTLVVGRNGDDTDNAGRSRMPSSIIAIEVAP